MSRHETRFPQSRFSETHPDQVAITEQTTLVTERRSSTLAVLKINQNRLSQLGLLVVVFLWPTLAFAQTTSFTYQGRFTDGGTAANGTYDMQFKLFDTPGAGNQIGATITNSAVSVSNAA